MASTKYLTGLTNILMGDVASDGDAGTTLTAVGDTVSDTAALTTEDDTKTDFNIEESDSPVLSVVSQHGKITLAWSSYNNSVDNLIRMFGGTKTAATAPSGGGIASASVAAGGSGYTNGSYNGVSVTSTLGTGAGAKANVTVSGGAVTAITIVAGAANQGTGYAVNDTFTIAASAIGGTGSGFSGTVTAITTYVPGVGEVWNAPDTFLQPEQTIRVPWKQGGYILIPRALVTGKLNMSFKKSALSQIDITATVLQPNKTGVARLSVHSDYVSA